MKIGKIEVETGDVIEGNGDVIIYLYRVDRQHFVGQVIKCEDDCFEIGYRHDRWVIEYPLWKKSKRYNNSLYKTLFGVEHEIPN